MSPKTIQLSGKWISIIAMIAAAISTIITGMNSYLTTQEYGDMVLSFGVFLAAFSAWLSHHYTVVP